MGTSSKGRGPKCKSLPRAATADTAAALRATGPCRLEAALGTALLAAAVAVMVVQLPRPDDRAGAAATPAERRSNRQNQVRTAAVGPTGAATTPVTTPMTSPLQQLALAARRADQLVDAGQLDAAAAQYDVALLAAGRGETRAVPPEMLLPLTFNAARVYADLGRRARAMELYSRLLGTELVGMLETGQRADVHTQLALIAGKDADHAAAARHWRLAAAASPKVSPPPSTENIASRASALPQ